jgi:hypothetical protein
MNKILKLIKIIFWSLVNIRKSILSLRNAMFEAKGYEFAAKTEFRDTKLVSGGGGG